MKDNLKTLITNLPKVEPKERFVDETVSHVAKRKMVKTGERDLSYLLGLFSVVFGYLALKQTINFANYLGTTDFWGMIINDRQWISADFPVVWEAFLEANPFQYLGIILVLILTLSLSLYVLFIRKEETEKLNRSSGVVFFLILFTVLAVLLAFFLISIERL